MQSIGCMHNLIHVNSNRWFAYIKKSYTHTLQIYVDQANQTLTTF